MENITPIAPSIHGYARSMTSSRPHSDTSSSSSGRFDNKRSPSARAMVMISEESDRACYTRRSNVRHERDGPVFLQRNHMHQVLNKCHSA